MIIAAISTAAGAEPGIAERERRDQRAGDRRVVAGLGGDQALDRALAELLALACSRAWRAAYDDHAAMSSPTPGRMPTKTPIRPERRIVRQ